MTSTKDHPTRQRIQRTAAKLFAKNGYAATGIAELERAVGLGRGALYHHIESKENLLFEISREHVAEMVAFGESLIDEPLGADEKFRALARRLMTTIANNLPELTVFFSEHRALSSAHNKELLGLRDRFEAVWARVISQGVEEGRFRTQHPIVIKGVLGFYNYSYLWLEPRGELDPEAIADIFTDTLLDGLRARR